MTSVYAPADGIAPPTVTAATPAEVFARAARHGDEHVVKLADAVLDAYATSADERLLTARRLRRSTDLSRPRRILRRRHGPRWPSLGRMWPRIGELRTLALGTPGELRSTLNTLVLAGVKTATAGRLAEYAEEGEELEHVGERLALVDDDDALAGVVEITGVEVVRFADVPWDFARAEGEGDRSIEEWRAGHSAYWARPRHPGRRRHPDRLPALPPGLRRRGRCGQRRPRHLTGRPAGSGGGLSRAARAATASPRPPGWPRRRRTNCWRAASASPRR